MTSDDEEDYYNNGSRGSSMPGSFEESPGRHFPRDMFRGRTNGDAEDDLESGHEKRETGIDGNEANEGDDEAGDEVNYEDDDTIFDDDILAAGEMRNVPY
jgi:phosphatidate phosphatase LPIN